MAKAQESQNEYAFEEDERLAEEEAIADQLNAEQEYSAVQEQLRELSQQGKQFGKPSFFKYFVILFPLAFINDAVDIFTVFAAPTGLGALILVAVSYILTAIILGIMFLTRTKYKKAQKYMNELEAKLKNIQITIQRTSSLLARTGGKFKGSSRVGRLLTKASSSLGKLGGILKRNPLSKVALASVLSFLPLMTLSIFLAYRDEKKILSGASTAAKEIFS